MTIALALAALLLAEAAAPGPPAPPADAAERGDVRARTRALLGAIDRPVSAEAFRRLGPEVDGALAEIALSDDYPVFRARALAALVALRAAPAEGIHRRLAEDTGAPRTVRRAAVRGLAALLAPAPAAAALRPFVEGDPDPAVRAAAAEALARAAPAEGCAVVRGQAAREDGAGAAFRRALAACDRHRRGAARQEPGR